MLAETIGRLSQAASRAATVLGALFDSENEAILFRAALGVIDVMIRSRAHGELAAWVAELEHRLVDGETRSCI